MNSVLEFKYHPSCLNVKELRVMRCVDCMG